MKGGEQKIVYKKRRGGKNILICKWVVRIQQSKGGENFFGYHRRRKVKKSIFISESTGLENIFLMLQEPWGKIKNVVVDNYWMSYQVNLKQYSSPRLIPKIPCTP